MVSKCAVIHLFTNSFIYSFVILSKFCAWVRIHLLLFYLAQFYSGWYAPPGMKKQIIKTFLKRNKSESRKLLTSSAEIVCSKKPLKVNHCGGKNNKPCLFNLDNDPCEFHDVSKQYPIIYNIMLRKLDDYRKRMVKSRRTTIRDPGSNPKLHGGAWVSWKIKKKEKRSNSYLEWLFPFSCSSKKMWMVYTFSKLMHAYNSRWLEF